MVQRKKLGSIVFNNYIRQVKISNKVRPKYWEWNGITIKSGSKKLLQKYINPDKKKEIILNDGNVLPQHLKSNYSIIGFKGNKEYEKVYSSHGLKNIVSRVGDTLTPKQLKKDSIYYLCINTTDNWYEKVIANPTKVDKPSYQIINGNYIYNNKLNPFTVGKMFDAIKEYYYKQMLLKGTKTLQNVRELINNSYPIIIEMEIFDTIKSEFDNTKKGHGRKWDVGNRADPYMKTFLDFLGNGYLDIEPFIEDDDRLHISSGNNVIFTPIEDSNNKKLVFHFYKDNREIWQNYIGLNE